MRSVVVSRVNRRKPWIRKYTVAICLDQTRTIFDTVHRDIAKDLWRMDLLPNDSSEEIPPLPGDKLPRRFRLSTQAQRNLYEDLMEYLCDIPWADEIPLPATPEGYPKMPELRARILKKTRDIFEEYTKQQLTDEMEVWKLVYAALRKCVFSSVYPLGVQAYAFLCLAALWKENDTLNADEVNKFVEAATEFHVNIVDPKPNLDFVTELLEADKIYYSEIPLHNILLMPCQIRGSLENVVLVLITPETVNFDQLWRFTLVRGFLPVGVIWDFGDLFTRAVGITTLQFVNPVDEEKLCERIKEKGLKDNPPQYTIGRRSFEKFSGSSASGVN